MRTYLRTYDGYSLTQKTEMKKEIKCERKNIQKSKLFLQGA